MKALLVPGCPPLPGGRTADGRLPHRPGADTAWESPSRRSTPSWRVWVVFALAALSFAALALAARVTSADGAQSLSLVWPAGGVGLLWYVASPTTRVALASLTAAFLLHGAVMLATGSGQLLALVTAAASIPQTALAGELIRRWAPELLGAREQTTGSRTVGTPTVAVAAVTAGTLVAAALGSGAIDLLGVEVAGSGLLFWWGKQLTGTLLVAAVAYVMWVGRLGPARSSVGASPLEATALVLLGTAGYLLVFVGGRPPFVFVLTLFAVWAGARLPTLSATVFSAGCGVMAIGATIAGRGPFALLETPQLGSLVTQVFVLSVLLTTLAVSVARDARVMLGEELAEAHRDTAARAELLDAMTESMTEGIVVVDGDDRLVRSNRAARELLTPTETGFRSSVAAYRVYDLDGSELPVEEMPAHVARVEGRAVERDIVLRDLDGARRVLAVRAVPLGLGADDRPTAASASVVVYRDVTGECERRDRLTEFAETVAHDLRNPLTAARGWTEQAEDVLAASPAHATGGALDALARVSSALDRMGGLIGELLTSARSERLEPRPVDLAEVVRRVAVELDREGNVVVGGLPEVLADPELVHQLVTNLLGNACKYVAPGVEPAVEVAAQRVGDCVEVRFTDNGIGVAPEEREHIFERRHRVQGSADDYEGTGLGLAICRDVAERHGGSIRCEGAPSGGSTFVLELPAA